MRISLLATCAALAVAAASPAYAGTFITAGGQVSIDSNDLANIPFTWTVITNATQGTELSGLQSKIVYTLTAINGAKTIFDLSYALDNTSTGAGSQSSIAVFGFDVSGTPDFQITSGPFAEGNGGNFSGLGQRDVCLYEGSNCNGGGNAGLRVTDPIATGSFRLTFASAQTNVILENFATRWQRTGINANGSASGIGTDITTPVPEPATWAMMIAGFGLVGSALRRRGRVELHLA